MQRRSFLQAAAAAGLALTIPSVVRRVNAAEPFTGPFWVQVHASGGWDPTLMFDPKLASEHTRAYSEVARVGNIPFAPTPIDLAALNVSQDYDYQTRLLSNEQFLNKYGGRLTVINGVDTKTNNHDSGTRSMWSGQTGEGYPSLGALIAATQGPGLPMAYISSGGYDATQGLVGLTRVSSVSSLQRIARPNLMDPQDLEGDKFHTADTWQRIGRYQRERIQRLQEREGLLRPRAAMGALEMAREADGDLSRLELPAELVTVPGNDLNDLQRMMQQSQIALHAFKSGIGASATLSIGGFDSHANNDRDQRRQLAKLLAGIDYLVTYAGTLGLQDKLYVVVASDFGRTPYNDRDGKDHHPISTMFAMGPNIPGDRVIGATTEDRLAFAVDPNGLQPVSSGGVTITPTLIQRALRRAAGVDAELDAAFPLGGAELPLFS
ncbi:MAG: DUF1501 domain-containing protein [Polyangiaceae bacterium]|nr:DUF1501 domain-containing protein [Polyangiaceae bacterium]MCW5789615.1 DUF1501 domain-containing protein [Polyangiaceae bacterium]